MWCIIIPVLVGFLSALLGYLAGRHNLKDLQENNDREILKLKNEITALKTDLEACKESKLELASDLKLARKSNSGNTEIDSSFTSTDTAALMPFDAETAKAVFGKKIKQDDLKIIGGIGPKIEELFHSSGIKTWKALGETSIEKCQKVLDSGGKRYRIHKPATWPQQATLAYRGKWKDLLKWQGK